MPHESRRLWSWLIFDVGQNMKSLLYILVALSISSSLIAASDPRDLAQAVSNAWSMSNVSVLAVVAHPELTKRLRTARISEFYVNDKPEKKKVLESGSDDQVIALFCESLRVIVPPQDPRLEYFDRFIEAVPKGELLIVRFESGWKRRADGKVGSSGPNEVILKKSGDEWRFLWSPAISIHVDLSWNPRS